MTIQQAGSALALLGTLFFCTPAANADDGAGKVTTVPVPGRGRPVVAKTDKEGTIHLLYDSEDGPKYAKSTDDGMTFGSAIPVVVGGLRQAGLEYSAWDMAVGKGGRIHVAMSTNAWKLKLPQEEWGFFYASLDPGAAAFSPVRNINHKPSEGFSLAADDKGNVTACWLSDKLYANVSHDNGETFAPFVEIDTPYNPCNCCTTSAAYGEDGRLAVLYREETNNERDMYLVLWDQDRGQVVADAGQPHLVEDRRVPHELLHDLSRAGGIRGGLADQGANLFRSTGRPRRTVAAGGNQDAREVRHADRHARLECPRREHAVAWKNDDQIGWQLYGQQASPWEPGSAKSSGNGVAGVVGKDGRFILFR